MKTRLTRSWLPLLIVALAGITALALAQSSSNSSSSKGSSASGNKTVSVTNEKVNGQSEQVLTNKQGMTLYYSTKDTPNKSTCTGACAQTWKALTISTGKPSGSSKLQGKLSTLKTQSGKEQVEYKGHPLYTYSKDQKKGDVKGAGKGSFKVATVSIKQATGASGGSSNGGSSNGNSSGGNSTGA
ncbi:MAG TPA: hypothetical protein VKB31_04860 [Trueperaceae bacterium]|nr:hypothetical protein [Trueperaceae bacterium]